MTPPHIVPEWYYLPFYAILRSIPNKLAGVIAMFSAIVVLAFLPWLDTAKVRSAQIPSALQAVLLDLRRRLRSARLSRRQPPEGIYVLAARILSVSYFAFFLVVLPLLGLVEKTKPVPATIADAVLAKHGSQS